MLAAFDSIYSDCRVDLAWKAIPKNSLNGRSEQVLLVTLGGSAGLK
jgi:hypothetical protein